MVYNMFYFYEHPVNFLVLFVLLCVWELVWKSFGLWFSAQNKQKGWFIFMLLFNTAGLLPIIYLIWFKPKQKREAHLKASTKSVRKKK